MLLVWDNLAGHKTAEMVVWLCRHGIMPLYTPLGGSWLTMAEAIRRILKRRSLEAPQPRRAAPAEPHRDRRLVRADRACLEPAAHALPLERQAPATAAQTTRQPTRHRRRRSTYVAAVTSPPKPAPRMAVSGASGPL